MASRANSSANDIRTRLSRLYSIFKNKVLYSKYMIKDNNMKEQYHVLRI